VTKRTNLVLMSRSTRRSV